MIRVLALSLTTAALAAPMAHAATDGPWWTDPVKGLALLSLIIFFEFIMLGQTLMTPLRPLLLIRDAWLIHLRFFHLVQFLAVIVLDLVNISPISGTCCVV